MYLPKMLILKGSKMEVIAELEKIIPEFMWCWCDENWNAPFYILMNKQKEIIRTAVVVAYFDEPYQNYFAKRLANNEIFKQ